MKKHILSLLLIGTFGTYAFYSQTNHGTTVAVDPTQPTTLIVDPTPVPTTTGKYKDGTYVGSGADAYYGTLQVKATVKNGLLSDVAFLQYPNDRGTSVQINQRAMPILKSEAIQIQSANVDVVSGATDSSGAFRESLCVALKQATLI